jgi:hypothetical protein
MKLASYLRHEISSDELVAWAEQAMMEGEFAARGHGDVRDVVARLGLADVRAFGLTWEDCEDMLHKLGYSARVDVTAH